jgi:hypothetical protein
MFDLVLDWEGPGGLQIEALFFSVFFVTILIEHRNKYLDHTTEVNVYTGVSYNRNESLQTDSWWMCVTHRDINTPQPAPGTPPKYPAPVIIRELQKTSGNRYLNLNLPIPKTLPPGQYPFIFCFIRNFFRSWIHCPHRLSI